MVNVSIGFLLSFHNSYVDWRCALLHVVDTIKCVWNWAFFIRVGCVLDFYISHVTDDKDICGNNNTITYIF